MQLAPIALILLIICVWQRISFSTRLAAIRDDVAKKRQAVVTLTARLADAEQRIVESASVRDALDGDASIEETVRLSPDEAVLDGRDGALASGRREPAWRGILKEFLFVVCMFRESVRGARAATIENSLHSGR